MYLIQETRISSAVVTLLGNIPNLDGCFECDTKFNAHDSVYLTAVESHRNKNISEFATAFNGPISGGRCFCLYLGEDVKLFPFFGLGERDGPLVKLISQTSPFIYSLPYLDSVTHLFFLEYIL